MKNNRLLGIDMQWDFCHPGVTDYNPNRYYDFISTPGALYVPGAEDDCEVTASLINEYGDDIMGMSIPMDTHRPSHIAHADYWRNKNGDMPKNFVELTKEEIANEIWFPAHPNGEKHLMRSNWVKDIYMKNMSRNPMTIWPKHCLWGTGGWQIYPIVQEAIQRWCEKTGKSVDLKFKGLNENTEWFSAVKAEVADVLDPDTFIDVEFLNPIKEVDNLLITGQALSHCLRWTVMDIIESIGREFAKKCTIIRDCTSSVPVPIFIKNGEDFLEKFQDWGGKVITAAEVSKIL